jgi:hypothetical protein
MASRDQDVQASGQSLRYHMLLGARWQLRIYAPWRGDGAVVRFMSMVDPIRQALLPGARLLDSYATELEMLLSWWAMQLVDHTTPLDYISRCRSVDARGRQWILRSTWPRYANRHSARAKASLARDDAEPLGIAPHMRPADPAYSYSGLMSVPRAFGRHRRWYRKSERYIDEDTKSHAVVADLRLLFPLARFIHCARPEGLAGVV